MPNTIACCHAFPSLQLPVVTPVCVRVVQPRRRPAHFGHSFLPLSPSTFLPLVVSPPTLLPPVVSPPTFLPPVVSPPTLLPPPPPSQLWGRPGQHTVYSQGGATTGPGNESPHPPGVPGDQQHTQCIECCTNEVLQVVTPHVCSPPHVASTDSVPWSCRMQHNLQCTHSYVHIFTVIFLLLFNNIPVQYMYSTAMIVSLMSHHPCCLSCRKELRMQATMWRGHRHQMSPPDVLMWVHPPSGPQCIRSKSKIYWQHTPTCSAQCKYIHTYIHIYTHWSINNWSIPLKRRSNTCAWVI